MDKWEEVGEIGVDAGMVMIGDPYYTLGDNATHRVKDWGDFCENHYTKEKGGVSVHPFGIAVHSGLGDGTYKVFVKRKDMGTWGVRIAEMRVVFISGRG